MVIMQRVGIALFFLLTITAASASNDLTGVVVDPGASALSGATVYVYTAFPKVGVGALCPSCYRDCGKHVSANHAGQFRLKALDPTLRFNLLAVADGYEPSFVRNIDPMGGPVTIKLTLRSIADADRLITGTVVDPHGKPVVGATVVPNGYRQERRVTYGTIPGIDQLSFTNAKGAFALRIPAADAKLDVLVTARSLAPHIERMLAPGQSRTIPLTEGATITGHVMRDGKPLAGARVGFVQTDRASSDFLGHFEIGTNDDGLFVMTNMGPHQTYTVYTPMEALSVGVAEPRIVNVGDDKASTDAGTLVVGPGRRIAGRIVVPERASIPPHTQILVIADDGGDARSVEVQGDGTFSFDGVPKGVTELSMRIPGLTLMLSPPAHDVELPTEGDVTDACLMFERPRPHAPAANAGSARISRVTANGNVIQAVISPDAKFTAYVTSDQGQQTLLVRDVASGQTLTLVPARLTAYWGMTFTPDSSAIYYGIKDKLLPAGGAIYQISTRGGQPRKIIEGIDSQPTFSPDGKQLAFLRAGFPTPEESAVLIANSDGTGVHTLQSVHAPDLFAPIFFAGASWSPDGTMIATSVIRVDKQAHQSTQPPESLARPQARIVTIDVASGSVKTIVDHGFAIVGQAAWMPDQKGIVAIAMASSGRSAQVWYVPYPTGEPQLITRDLLNYRIVSLSADGKSLLTVASEVIADLISRDAVLITGFRPGD